MGVQRFKTFDDARRANWLPQGDTRLVRRMAWVWAWTGMIGERDVPRGVQRFLSLDAANLERERRVRDRVDRLRARRSKS